MSGSTLGAPPVPPPGSVIFPESVQIAATTAATAVELPVSAAGQNVKNYPFLNVFNSGPDMAFFVLGIDNTVTATVNSIPVPPNKGICVWGGIYSYISAICATGTATLNVYQSNGPALPE